MNVFEEDLGNLPIVHVVKGGCMGVAIHYRGPNDPHLCFALLSEDDENWFLKSNSGSPSASTAWLEEMVEVLEMAQYWMEEHCERDGAWGWKAPDNLQQRVDIQRISR